MSENPESVLTAAFICMEAESKYGQLGFDAKNIHGRIVLAPSNLIEVVHVAIVTPLTGSPKVRIRVVSYAPDGSMLESREHQHAFKAGAAGRFFGTKLHLPDVIEGRFIVETWLNDERVSRIPYDIIRALGPDGTQA